MYKYTPCCSMTSFAAVPVIIPGPHVGSGASLASRHGNSERPRLGYLTGHNLSVVVILRRIL